jgi:hypothetical protein
MGLHMRRKWFFVAPAALAGVALFVFIGGEFVMLLWNWLAPQLFGWREITFWQALGLLALCRLLFGGFGRHGGSRLTARMTPEERDRFRKRIRERCGLGPSAPEGQAR